MADAAEVWTAGDYPDLARTVEGVSEVTVDAVGVAQGEALADIATGTGNLAVIAARRGARVTGLDITPKLLGVARERAAAESLDIEFVEGDAEQLPFADASFPRVTSVFGVMFAPDQPRAAAELRRICSPGGTIAVAAWTPEGINGQLFKVVGPYMPPPPPGFTPPVLWGVESRVGELFAGADVTTERRMTSVDAETPAAWVDYISASLGPIALARPALEAQGTWDDLQAALLGLFEKVNGATDGSLHLDAEYLLTVVRV